MPDLSQFGTPAAPPQQAPQQPSGVDLSQFGTPAAPPSTTDNTDFSDDRLANARYELGELNAGFTHGLSETGLTAQKLIGKLPLGAGDWFTRHTATARAADEARAAMQMNSPGRVSGNLIENILEAASGDEALKGLSMVGKIKELGSVFKVLQGSPEVANVMARVINTGARQAVLSGGQAAAHGQSAEDVVSSGLLGAAMGTAAEGVGGLARLKAADIANELAPTTKDIEGGQFTSLRSQAVGPEGQSTATPRQMRSANIATEPETRAANLRAYRTGEATIAQRGIRTALEQANAARPQELPVVTDPARLIAPTPEAPAGITLQTGTPPVDVSTPPKFAPTTMQVVEPATVPNPNYQPLGGEAAARTGATDTRTPAQVRLDDLGGASAAVPTESVTGPETIQQPRPPVYNQPQITKDALMVRTGGGTVRLSPGEARQMQTGLQQRLMTSDLGVREKAGLQSQLTDLTDQLNRYDEYLGQQPHYPVHDVEDAVNNTSSFGDAAKQLQASALQKIVALDADPDIGDQFRQLRDQQRKWSNIQNNSIDPGLLQQAKTKLSGIGNQIEDLFAQPGVRERLSGSEADLGMTQYRQSRAFQALQDAIDQHFNFTPDEASAIGRPRTSQNMEGFTKSIRGVENEYGDVLKPLLGDDGLNHLKEMGEYLNTGPNAQDELKSVLGQTGVALRRHYGGIRSIVLGAAEGNALGMALGHHALTAAGGPAAGLGLLSGEGAYRLVLNRMATDPGFAERVLYAAKNHVSPRVAGPLLAATFMNLRRDTQQQQQNATPPEGGTQ